MTNKKREDYSYLQLAVNIPDASGHDSLFQAESRRCKEIIGRHRPNEYKCGKNERHSFCIFDDLKLWWQ